MTLLLVGVTVAAYLLELAAGGLPACRAYGLVPAHFSRSGDLGPVFSSLLLHDPTGWGHLVGNMAFLAVFGAIVEGSLGRLRLLSLYLAAGVFGGLLHVLVAPGSTDPLVGASGAICGVMAVAGVLRPRLLGFVVAFGALNVWHAFTGGADSVSFGAHLGGLFAGVVFAGLRAAVPAPEGGAS